MDFRRQFKPLNHSFNTTKGKSIAKDHIDIRNKLNNKFRRNNINNYKNSHLMVNESFEIQKNTNSKMKASSNYKLKNDLNRN